MSQSEGFLVQWPGLFLLLNPPGTAQPALSPHPGSQAGDLCTWMGTGRHKQELGSSCLAGEGDEAEGVSTFLILPPSPSLPGGDIRLL